MSITYLVSLTDEEIEAIDDLKYYGGEHLLITWCESDYDPLLSLVDTALDKMKAVRENAK